MKALQNLLNAVNAGSFGHKGPVNHNHRQTQLVRGVNRRPRPHATRILGDDVGDAVRLQQVKIALQRERAACNQGRDMGQGQSGGLINQPQKIMMLWPCGEIFQRLPTYSQEHPRWIIGQGRDSARHIGNVLPKVAFGRLPRRAFKGQQRGLGYGGGFDRVAAHLGREGVGCVDQVGDTFSAQIAHQSLYPAKAANALGQGLAQGCFGASGVGENRINALIRHGFRQIRGLGRAAKQKDAGHG